MASLRTVVRLYGLNCCVQPVCSAFKTSAYLSPKLCTHQWRSLPHSNCSTIAPSNGISVKYKHGRPVLELPLPSRQEKCLFFLRPMLWNVSDFVQDIQREDPGVVTASVLTTDGVKVASTTSLDVLLSRDFQLCINDITYTIHAAPKDPVTGEQVSNLGEMKTMVHMLHAALHLPKHHLTKEKQLLQKLDLLKQELMPMEQMRLLLDVQAERSSSRTLWAGLALLSVQGGALAWLTWWVYSWDIMEPVTYFLTYSTSIGIYAYYVLTKQDYVYPDAKDRQFLHYFYKGVRRQKFSVQKYNMLKDQLASVEEDLSRLRNPNQLGLPAEPIQSGGPAVLSQT